MNEFPNNSKTQRAAEEKNVEKVVQGDVSPRKKSIGRQFKDVFIGGDSKSVIHYVVFDVLVPQAKDMLAEAATQGFERMIFGDSRPSSGRRFGSRSGNVGHTNYNRYADRGNNPIGRSQREERPSSPAQVRSHGLEDILLATRIEAETVLDHMYDLLSQYDRVSVSDLFSLIGWSASYVDGKWGWSDLRGSDIRRIRDGYILNLPKPHPLD